MLNWLSISNIVLIESARLDFSEGLTVLTGETGSGKSAILKALSLVLGARADTTLIRTGASKGRVEAAFAVEQLPGVISLLEEGGIDHERGEELIISREIPIKGSSRSFVNQQLVQGVFLKRLAANLLDLAYQSANIRLTSPSYHLETVDLYGGISPTTYQQHYRSCQELRKEIESLTQNEAERLRKEARLQAELEEVAQAAPQEGEEETLFQEYTRLTHAEELTRLLHEGVEALSGEQGAQSLLAHSQKQLTRASELDPTLEPAQKTLEGIALELHELTYTLKNNQGQITYNPERLETVERRLSLLNGLHKKYGPDLLAFQQELEEELEKVSGGQERVKELQIELQEEEAHCSAAAKALSKIRHAASKKLQEAVTAHLRPLNLKEAQFEVRIEQATPTLLGTDHLEFFFAPNLGEGSLSVRKCASGGELSRLLLALKTALSGLENTPTLIFDEIDSGMGGKTAVLVGQKLKTIATGRQVLCITHLTQVARQADHHFAIEKVEEGGRTLTRISEVDGAERKEELSRMEGGLLQKGSPS